MASANTIETEASTGHRSSTMVIAIIVPSALLIVFLTLVLLNRRVGLIRPGVSSYANENTIRKEERWKRRQSVLEENIQSQHFYDWLATQKEKRPDALQTSDSLCAICLEEFAEDAQIRGLHCSHAFHSHCLDEWFTRYNEFCPLCHRPILPGVKLTGHARQRPAPLPIILVA
ncbi:hypothetical protein ACN47E_006215 [Coniothyrium glycines]